MEVAAFFIVCTQLSMLGILRLSEAHLGKTAGGNEGLNKDQRPNCNRLGSLMYFTSNCNEKVTGREE
jgi:hypothetical protein